MNDYIHKYFNGELTDKEKEEFILSVHQNPILKIEFIEAQNALGITNLLLQREDTEKACLSLSKFIQDRNNVIE
ncbi:MAG: anti-sigma factor [Dysgonomonas sp.]|nr:anti-sigma factor [Dysgonomonas sp.]